ncbi:hypothetical protein [Marinoscillum sp.]|uniref:hypothetical protein n=1 Tax=Marinoscillum sp. TaxID=2024838 RepID=UPI003BAD200B
MRFWQLILLGALVACQSNKDPRDSNYPINTSTYESGLAVGSITDQRLLEISGLEYSLKNAHHLWTHNDSQGQPSLYLIDTSGTLRMTVYLQGAENYDWEDITSDGEHLYIADIGDNRAVRPSTKIYMLEEPLRMSEDSVVVKDWLEMTLSYSNGPRDAETLMYDYLSGKLVIVSKRDDSCMIYSFEFSAGDSINITPKGQVDLRMFTAGDMDESGAVVLKNYNSMFYWSASNEPFVERFVNGPDSRIPYTVEPQGEAVTFASEGSLYTASEFNEHAKQQLYLYRRK